MFEQVCSSDQAEGLRQLMTVVPARQVLVFVTSTIRDKTSLYRQLASEMLLQDMSCLSEVAVTEIKTLEHLSLVDKEIVICLNFTAQGIKHAYLMLKMLAKYSRCTQIGIYVVANNSRQAKTIFTNLSQLAECSLSLTITFIGHTTPALHCSTQRNLTSSRMC